jgi:hypothetical protein
MIVAEKYLSTPFTQGEKFKHANEAAIRGCHGTGCDDNQSNLNIAELIPSRV